MKGMPFVQQFERSKVISMRTTSNQRGIRNAQQAVALPIGTTNSNALSLGADGRESQFPPLGAGSRTQHTAVPAKDAARFRWWMPIASLGVVWLALLADQLLVRATHGAETTAPALPLMALLHAPYVLILALLAFGLVERIGFYWRGREPHVAGTLPALKPKVCIQLPMFNEHAVAQRVIEAAAAVRWPRDRLEVQVLDDSTDPETRAMVREICAAVEAKTGVTCAWVHRTDRAGYKAGALEAGRKQSDADFIAIFDADFLPPPDYLERALPHFYDNDSAPVRDLALVQAQWGHLNDDESLLTEAQALWVDDHHSLQQSWRSANIDFVNFTGTAGVFRASAIEAAGGWKSASLVEDCELSFRVLFAGYRTRFIRQLAVPAELPQTFAAYRLQQKRWTQGWAQLQRLHFAKLLLNFKTPVLRKLHLIYVMCIGWQWPLWALWIAMLPFLIANGQWLGAFGTTAALIGYVLPPLLFAFYAGFVATRETNHGSGSTKGGFLRRCARVVPYLVVNAGMLPHHLCAFAEGLFGPMHAEFERTPKTASVTDAPGVQDKIVPAPAPASKPKSARKPYVVAEVLFVAVQLAWIATFVRSEMAWGAIGAASLAASILTIRAAPWVGSLVEQRIARKPKPRLEA
jgi:cellulose synthase/poly-beta-1,6-N-acetylglucosamine synthase-like glycosyltransferase